MTQVVQSFLPGLEGAERRRDLSQFYTPDWLARRLWRWSGRARYDEPLRVLEPAAGRGALIRPIAELSLRVREVVAYEVDPYNVDVLEVLKKQLHSPWGTTTPATIVARDFLAATDVGRFDLGVLNPPFEDNQDVAFAARVLECCTCAIGIFAARIEHSAGRREFWRWHDQRRKVVLSKRPQFGGEFSPMTDFIVLELVRRPYARKQGEPTTTSVEWW